VANRCSVADTETVDDLIRIKFSALDFGNRDVDIAAEETSKECEKRQIGRQPEHFERMTDQANLDQDEKEAQDKKEENCVEYEERCEEHRARIARRRIPSQPQNRTATGKESVLLSGGQFAESAHHAVQTKEDCTRGLILGIKQVEQRLPQQRIHGTVTSGINRVMRIVFLF
jgi:hypothetical protein